MASPDYLDLDDGRRIAYHRTEARGEGAARPGVVFLGGFASDMTGTKATFLERWARETGRAFLRFDYTGHGRSSGAFEEGCVGDWARDAEDALARLTEGPQIVVGSSMGGWIALILARRAPERFAGLIGIAAAPDFTEDLIWVGMSDAQRAALRSLGRMRQENPYEEEPQTITLRLIEDGRAHLVLRTPLHLPFPVRLLHGTADLDVPPEIGLRTILHIDCVDARFLLVKGADHRFSGARELAILREQIETL